MKFVKKIILSYDETANADEEESFSEADELGFKDTSTSLWKRISWANIFTQIQALGGELWSSLAHASRHVNGSDDIQIATSSQKGFASPAHITKLNLIITTYPSFYVHRNGVNQTVTTGVDTLIDWTTKESGYIDSGFNLSTNRDTPLVEGIYTYTLRVYCVDSTISHAVIKKNGSIKIRDVSSDLTARITISFYMNGTTDYVEGFGRNIGGTEFLGDATYTVFSGSLTSTV